MAKTPLFGRLRRVAREVLDGQGRAPGRRSVAIEGLPRRDFVSLALALGATSLLGTPGCSDDEGVTPKPGGKRIAIVGGGVAGLHCAYRLKLAGVASTVYEASDRVGGRMYTGRGLFDGDLLCELGGELIDTNHLTLFGLADELGIALDDRLKDAPAGYKTDVFFVNGKEVPDTTILTQFAKVAPLMATAVTDAEADDAKFTALDETSLAAWLDQNVPAATYPELHGVLSTAYRGEFGLENEQQSALNLLYLIDYETTDPFHIFGDSDERHHTHLGNDTFTTKLAEAIPGQIELGHKLIQAADSGGAIKLTFAKTAGGELELSVDHVVFALPFTLLREVNLDGLTLSADKRTIIAELGYGTNAKVMGGYKTRPWLTQHNASGSVTTDLPFQQTWDSSIGQAGTAGVLTNFLGGTQGLNSGQGTPEAWFAQVATELDQVFPGSKAEHDGKAVRMHWPTVPTMKASYTCYLPGQWAFSGSEGLREGNVHFCGEHCSLDFQGWMEGGAETGGLVAAELLDQMGVKKPAAHEAFVALKTVVPQSCYRATDRQALRFRARRQLLREARAARQR
ncbi:MAG: FAD-dependent oxidoreductase [Myxococcales bacterium]|nr:FAD-dependent oxidoreductase [Myxococcales bacterium]